jgi:GntR family transcriptional regulator
MVKPVCMLGYAGAFKLCGCARGAAASERNGLSMFQIDAMSRTPVYEQIISQVEKFILGGILGAGAQLPSVRSLSMELSVNPNTIQKAYGELDVRGIISTVPGRGCFITESALGILRQISRNKLASLEELVAELWAAGVSRKELDDAVDRGTAGKQPTL